MAFTKKVSKHDRIDIDGTDYSNCFNEFGFTSADSNVDVSGFSVSGVDELLPGARAQSFTGTMYITEESIADIFDLHNRRAVVEIEWQPDGLVNSSATVFYGMCTISEFSPTDTRGSASTTAFSAPTADSNGIRSARHVR